MGMFAKAARQISLGGMGTYDQGIGFLAVGRADLLGSLAASNVNVSYNRAMKVPAYGTGIRVISEDVAAAPLITYEQTDTGRRRATDHPTYAVLHSAWNPYMTSMVARETLQAHVLSWGNCYGSMVMDGQQVVTAIWPLRPDQTEPKIDASTGRLFYRTLLPSGEPRDLRREEVFHLPGLGFDGIIGYPVLTAMMREALGTAIAQQDYVGSFYGRDARPGVYLKHPGRLSDEASKRLVGNWDEKHAGLTGAHRTAILEEGMDVGTIGVSPVEQQLLESRKWSATEIGGCFRLAPWKIGVYDRATWANVEDGNIDHWQSALRAWFVRWEQQLTLQVYGVGSRYFAEHLIEGILRGNSKARAEYYFLMRQASGITANEIRDRENLPHDPSPAADQLFSPLNMASIGTTSAVTAPAAAPSQGAST